MNKYNLQLNLTAKEIDLSKETTGTEETSSLINSQKF